MEKNTAIIVAVGALVVGGLGGYFTANASNPFSRSYLQEDATSMKNDGASMMQMGNMMSSVGKMMQQKGAQYKDAELMQAGKDLEQSAQTTQAQGTDMTNRGNGMMQMMGGQ